MAHPTVSLFEPPERPPAFRFDGRPPGLAPRSVEAIGADLAAASGASWVVLAPFEPTRHPDLVAALAPLAAHGLRAKALSDGRDLVGERTLEDLRDAGLAQLTVPLYGPAAVHDRLVGHDGAFEAALEALAIGAQLNRLLLTVRLVVLRENVAELPDLVGRVRALADRLELVRLSTLTRQPDVLKRHEVRRRDAIRAVQSCWEAARVTHLPLSTDGFASFPSLPVARDVPVQPADATLLDLLRGHVPVPSGVNGTWATPRDGDLSGVYHAVEHSRDLQELGLQLAAYGCPALDLPTDHGGLGLDFPPAERAQAEADGRIAPRRRDGVPMLLRNAVALGEPAPPAHWTGSGRDARVAVLAPYVSDNVLVLSTLPALVERLRAHGADAHLHSVWDAPFNPFDPGARLPDGALAPSDDPERPGHRYPEDLVEAFANPLRRIAFARERTPAFLADLDLTGVDLVVVPGWEAAHAVWRHPTLSPSARVVVPDFHLMTGIEGWHGTLEAGARPMDGGWWPDPRLQVHAIYPRYVRTYWRAGVPLRQVHWRPYPVHPGHFGAGPPPAACDTVFAGGNHQRDWVTLARAIDLGGDRLPTVQVMSHQPVPRGPEILPPAPLLGFHEAVANSRFVVLPLEADPRRPAGISLISLALAAGRPVVATATHATVDHLRHGVDAWLVPPRSPAALAEAIARLHADPVLLERLAAGARASSAAVSVDRWARDLLDGAPAATTFPADPDHPHTGPFRAWPVERP